MQRERVKRHCLLCGVAALISLVDSPDLAAQTMLPRVTVTDVDGRQTAGQLISLSASRLVVQHEVREEFELSSVHRVDFATTPQNPPRRSALLLLGNGDRIWARPLRLNEDALVAQWSLDSDWTALRLPLETLRGMILQMPKSKPAQDRLAARLESAQAPHDAIWTTSGGRIQGEITEFSAGEFRFETAIGSVATPQSRVRAMCFNPELMSVPDLPGLRTVITAIDGTRLTGSATSLRDGAIRTRLMGTIAVDLPASVVTSLQISGGRSTSLSELEPTEVEALPFSGTVLAWRRNRNVLSGPLRLRGRISPFGVGMHSQTTLSYRLNGRFASFHSTVGLDDAAPRTAHAECAVLVDGQVAWRAELRAGEPPLSVPPLNLSSANTLSLRVLFGKSGSAGDFANWCDARIVRR